MLLLLMVIITDFRPSRCLLVDDNEKPRGGKDKWDWKEVQKNGQKRS
jgi:hypothetical protein